MYLISFYVPESHLQIVKQALFKKGAGKAGNYDCCSWQSNGKGQFRPLKGSSPFKGKQNKVYFIDEYKVEMICRESIIKDVLKELVKTHPYEEPAFHAIKLESIGGKSAFDTC